MVHLEIVDDQHELLAGVLDQAAQESDEPLGVQGASKSMNRIRPRLLTAEIMFCVRRRAVRTTAGVRPLGA